MKTVYVTIAITITMLCLSGILYAGCEPPNEWPRVEKHYGGVASCPNYELLDGSFDFWTIHEPDENKPTVGIAFNHWDGEEVWRDDMMDLVDWTVTGATSWETTCRRGAIRVHYTEPEWTQDVIVKVDMSGYIPTTYKIYPQKSFGNYGYKRRIYSQSAALATIGIEFLRGVLTSIEWLTDPLIEGMQLVLDVVQYQYFGEWEPGQFGD